MLIPPAPGIKKDRAPKQHIKILADAPKYIKKTFLQKQALKNRVSSFPHF
jgi:hypothetical protein